MLPPRPRGIPPLRALALHRAGGAPAGLRHLRARHRTERRGRGEGGALLVRERQAEQRDVRIASERVAETFLDPERPEAWVAAVLAAGGDLPARAGRERTPVPLRVTEELPRAEGLEADGPDAERHGARQDLERVARVAERAER